MVGVVSLNPQSLVAAGRAHDIEREMQSVGVDVVLLQGTKLAAEMREKETHRASRSGSRASGSS